MSDAPEPCFIDPKAEAFAAFKALPRDRPIHMLNLLLFRDRAAYPAGHEHEERGWTGEEAYREYGRTSGPIFARVGGSIIWRGSFEAMVIGPTERRWHQGFVAAYPSSAAFLEMVTDADYRQAVVNRTAAVLDSRLLRFYPGEVSTGFA